MVVVVVVILVFSLHSLVCELIYIMLELLLKLSCFDTVPMYVFGTGMALYNASGNAGMCLYC